MTDHISPRQFRESAGVEDWRVISDGAVAYFRTTSFAESARFVQAMAQLPGIAPLRPDVDVRDDPACTRGAPARRLARLCPSARSPRRTS